MVQVHHPGSLELGGRPLPASKDQEWQFLRVGSIP